MNLKSLFLFLAIVSTQSAYSFPWSSTAALGLETVINSGSWYLFWVFPFPEVDGAAVLAGVWVLGVWVEVKGAGGGPDPDPGPDLCPDGGGPLFQTEPGRLVLGGPYDCLVSVAFPVPVCFICASLMVLFIVLVCSLMKVWTVSSFVWWTFTMALIISA